MKKITLTLSILLLLVITTRYSIGTVNRHHTLAHPVSSPVTTLCGRVTLSLSKGLRGGEEDTIRQYIADHNLQASRTPSGLYYVIEKQGSGKKVIVGKRVTVNYTGSLINGKVFDSNTDVQFNHTEPFTFPIGKGQVIKGWDEGIALFNAGGKGKLIIPSALAYGVKGAGENIPPNSVLVFDIEVLKVRKAK